MKQEQEHSDLKLNSFIENVLYTAKIFLYSEVWDKDVFFHYESRPGL